MNRPIHLDERGFRMVSDAVAAAEAHTSGEIVTIVADRSDSYADVVFAWAAIAAFLAIGTLAAFPAFHLAMIDRLLGNWTHQWSAGQVISLVLATGVTKFIAVTLVLQIPMLRFLLVPGPIRSARVHRRAVSYFKVGAERRTHGRTGVLIYLSLREHRAEILADRAIAEQVAPEIWGDAMGAMLAEIRAGRIAEGMVAAVDAAGQVLAQHFPRGDEDANELPDRLIEI